jgi:hypothetical protein
LYLFDALPKEEVSELMSGAPLHLLQSFLLALPCNESARGGAVLIYRSGIFVSFVPGFLWVCQCIHGATLNLLAVFFGLVTKVSC